MTLSNTNITRNDYTGDGSTDTFSFTFEVLDSSNLRVIITSVLGVESVKILDTDYTASINNLTKTGSITFTTPPADQEKISILLSVELTQGTNYINIGTDKFPADSHEAALDKLTLITRQLNESSNRGVSLPEGSSLSNITIPVSVANANKAIVVNNAGDDLDAKDLADIGAAPVTDYAKTLLDDNTAAEARTTLEIGTATESVEGIAEVATQAEVDAGVVDDKFITPAKSGSIKSGRKNLIINPGFEIDQRNAGGSAAGNNYGVDRWYASQGIGSTVTHQRKDFALGQTDVPGEPKNYLEITQTGTSTTKTALQQSIEGVRILAGQKGSYQFHARVLSGTRGLTPVLKQRFGTGGSPSPDLDTSGTPVILTTTWQNISDVVSIPSIAGKTIGTNNNDNLMLSLELDLGPTVTVQIAQVQVEKGDFATDFEIRSIAEEIELCQRYYHKTYEIDTTPGTITEAGTIGVVPDGPGAGSADVNWQYKVTMRAAPVITFYNPATGAAGTWRQASSDRSWQTSGIGDGTLRCNNNVSVTASIGIRGHIVADSEL
jgi:hypothetical protein